MSICCWTWIRTKINASKGRCPTIRRSSNSDRVSYFHTFPRPIATSGRYVRLTTDSLLWRTSVEPELLLTCRGCRRTAPLNHWGYVRKYWYDRPHIRGGQGLWFPKSVALCAVTCTQCGWNSSVKALPEWEEVVKLLSQVRAEDRFERVYEKYGHNPTILVHPETLP
jgi:hypothetical protein